MRIRGLLISVALLAVLGGLVYWSNLQKKKEESKPAEPASPKVLSIPSEQFQQVEIRKASGAPLVLKKGAAGKWEMMSPQTWPVDQDAAGNIVSTLSSLDSSRVVEEKATDLAQFGLASPPLEVAVTTKDGKTRKLFVGDDSPAGGGSFVRLDGDPRVFTIAAYNKTSFDKSAKDLRDKRLLTFDSDKLTRLELAVKGQTVEFGKNAQNEWQIIKPKPLRADGGQVEELIRRLKDAKMDATLTEEQEKKGAAAFSGGATVGTARVTDASGSQQIEVRRQSGKGNEKNYYAKSSVVEGVHKAGSDLGDELSKSMNDFRNKKLFDFGWSDPTKIELRDGAKQAVYQKSGDKWMLGARQMESQSVQALVDRLRDLAAIKFVDTGFTTPVIEAAVTSNDGKRVEKVLVSKQGNSYFAKRENEPSVYELDGKAVEELQKAFADVKEPQPKKK